MNENLIDGNKTEKTAYIPEIVIFFGTFIEQ